VETRTICTAGRDGGEVVVGSGLRSSRAQAVAGVTAARATTRTRTSLIRWQLTMRNLLGCRSPGVIDRQPPSPPPVAERLKAVGTRWKDGYERFAGGPVVRFVRGIEIVLAFRILGPLEVVDHERPVSLGGPKQRALLAILLLRRGEIISSDRLIDQLWDERPPL
jgi:hypothetical protein